MRTLSEVAELLTGLQAQHVVLAMERAGLTNPETICGACAEMAPEELSTAILAGIKKSAELPEALSKVIRWAVALKARAWRVQDVPAKTMASHQQLCITLQEVERLESEQAAERTSGPAAPLAKGDFLKKGKERSKSLVLRSLVRIIRDAGGASPIVKEYKDLYGKDAPGLLRIALSRNAAGTMKGHLCRWGMLARWAKQKGQTVYPTSTETLVRYLAYRDRQACGPSAVRAAVLWMHKKLQMQAPDTSRPASINQG